MKAIGIVLVFWAALLSMLWVSGCSSPQSETREYHPFVGCWQSEDGLAIEGWTQDPSGWLFGYAVNRDETNAVKFFEQMRMDGQRLYVTGPNDDTIAFELVEAETGIVFENPDHDYPQRIAYFPSPGRLDAEISLLDGRQKMDFKKRACR